MAARAAGSTRWTAHFADFRNDEGYRPWKPDTPTCSASSANGPSTPPRSPRRCRDRLPSAAEEVEPRARELATAYDAALAEGLGSVNVNGTMVDAASIHIVMNTVRKAELIGM